MIGLALSRASRSPATFLILAAHRLTHPRRFANDNWSPWSAA